MSAPSAKQLCYSKFWSVQCLVFHSLTVSVWLLVCRHYFDKVKLMWKLSSRMLRILNSFDKSVVQTLKFFRCSFCTASLNLFWEANLSLGIAVFYIVTVILADQKKIYIVTGFFSYRPVLILSNFLLSYLFYFANVAMEFVMVTNEHWAFCCGNNLRETFTRPPHKKETLSKCALKAALKFLCKSQSCWHIKKITT